MEDPKPTTEVRIMKRADGTMYYQVLVRSVVKPNLKKVGILEFERVNQRGDIGVLAGALAEELCEQYADTLEPNDAARAGERAYEKLRSILLGQPDAEVHGTGDELPRDADATLARKH